MGTTSDVVIIGDGILARTIAWELVLSGITVTRVAPKSGQRDAASPAAGAMLGALGEVTADDATAAAGTELDFRFSSRQMFPALLDQLEEAGASRPMSTRGTVVIGNNEGKQDVESLVFMHKAARSLGEQAEWVDADEVEGLKPARAYRPVRCLFLPDEDGIDAAALLDALDQALSASRHAASVDAAVSRVAQSRSGWTVSTSDGGTFSAPRVVVCAGAHTEKILGEEKWGLLGLPHLFFGKGVSCVVRNGPRCAHVLRTPNRAFACGAHVVPRCDGMLYLGATNFLGDDLEAEAEVEPGELHILFDQVIHQINVDVRRAKILSTRFGYRPIASNRQPIVGETTRDGLFVATGTYRNGFVMAPRIAALIKAEIVGGSPAPDNPYSPRVHAAAEIVDVDAVTEAGLRDLAEIIHEPGGRLPYDRSEELALLIARLWSFAFSETEEVAIKKKQIRESLKDVPLTETMNRLFYEIMAGK